MCFFPTFGLSVWFLHTSTPKCSSSVPSWAYQNTVIGINYKSHPHLCLFSWKVTPNKMQCHFWHLLLAQFFMLFHMVASVLLSLVAFSTIFWLVQILQQPIRIIEISGYWSCHGEESACYHVKEHKKLGQKLVSKVTLRFVWGHLPKKQTVPFHSPDRLTWLEWL